MDKKNAFRISVYTYVLLFVAALVIGLNILNYEGQDKGMFFGILTGVFALITLAFVLLVLWNKRRK